MSPVIMRIAMPDVDIIEMLEKSTVNSPAFDRKLIERNDIDRLKKVAQFLEDQYVLKSNLPEE